MPGCQGIGNCGCCAGAACTRTIQVSPRCPNGIGSGSTTASATYTFVTNDHGFAWTTTSGGPVTSAGRVATDGGVLSAVHPGGVVDAAAGYFELLLTPTAFSIGAGRSITAVRLNGISTKAAVRATGSTTVFGAVTLHSFDGTLLATLWTGRTATTAEGLWSNLAVQPDQTVSIPAEAPFRLRVALQIQGGPSGLAEMRIDNIALVLTHAPTWSGSSTGAGSTVELLDDSDAVLATGTTDGTGTATLTTAAAGPYRARVSRAGYYTQMSARFPLDCASGASTVSRSLVVWHWPTSVRVEAIFSPCGTHTFPGASVTMSGDLGVTIAESRTLRSDPHPYAMVSWHSATVPFADITVTGTVPAGKGFSVPSPITNRVWPCSTIFMGISPTALSGYVCTEYVICEGPPIVKTTGTYTDSRGSCTLTFNVSSGQWYGTYSYGSNPANSGLPYVVNIAIVPGSLTGYWGISRTITGGYSDTGDPDRGEWHHDAILYDCDNLPHVLFSGSLYPCGGGPFVDPPCDTSNTIPFSVVI